METVARASDRLESGFKRHGAAVKRAETHCGSFNRIGRAIFCDIDHVRPWRKRQLCELQIGISELVLCKLISLVQIIVTTTHNRLSQFKQQ